MTTEDRIIEIGQESPELANALQEFLTLSETAKTPLVQNVLASIVKGISETPYMHNATADFYPFELQNPDVVYKGGEGTGDLHVGRTSDGTLVSCWACYNFLDRLKFLKTGRLSLRIHSDVVPPISLTLDDTYFNFPDEE